MRTFQGFCPHPPADYVEKGTAVGPGEVQYEGIVFTDGTVAVRWRTEFRSTSVWSSWGDFWRVHGHPEYGTRIVWTGESEYDEDGCGRCGVESGYHVTSPVPLKRPVEVVTDHPYQPPPNPEHQVRSVEPFGAHRPDLAALQLVTVTCTCGHTGRMANKHVDVWMANHYKVEGLWPNPILRTPTVELMTPAEVMRAADFLVARQRDGWAPDLVIVDEPPEAAQVAWTPPRPPDGFEVSAERPSDTTMTPTEGDTNHDTE